MLNQILDEDIEDCEHAIKDCENDIDVLQTIVDLENQTKLGIQDVFRSKRMLYVLKGALSGEIAGFGAETVNLIAKVVSNSDQTPVPPVASFVCLLGLGTMAGYLNYRVNHKKQMTAKRDEEVALIDSKIKENEEIIGFYKQKKMKAENKLEEKIKEKQALQKTEKEAEFLR